MAERKKTSDRRKEDEAQPKSKKGEQGEAKKVESEPAPMEQKQASPLDNPMLPDHPDEIRHTIYFLTVVVGAFLLNFVVLVVLSGGR